MILLNLLKILISKFTGLLVILVVTQFALSAWSLAMREKLPGAAKHPVDMSYAEFVHIKNKADHTHVWYVILTSLYFGPQSI
jgi:hypothetical protein